jgi:hypothetical protein
MALIDDFKVAYRISINNEAINSQINDLIDEAKDDLTSTANIVIPANITGKIKGAILLYAGSRWYQVSDPDRSAALRDAYNVAKKELLMSSKYSDYEEVDNGQSD